MRFPPRAGFLFFDIAQASVVPPAQPHGAHRLRFPRRVGFLFFDEQIRHVAQQAPAPVVPPVQPHGARRQPSAYPPVRRAPSLITYAVPPQPARIGLAPHWAVAGIRTLTPAPAALGLRTTGEVVRAQAAPATVGFRLAPQMPTSRATTRVAAFSVGMAVSGNPKFALALLAMPSVGFRARADVVGSLALAASARVALTPGARVAPARTIIGAVPVRLTPITSVGTARRIVGRVTSAFTYPISLFRVAVVGAPVAFDLRPRAQIGRVLADGRPALFATLPVPIVERKEPSIQADDELTILIAAAMLLENKPLLV